MIHIPVRMVTSTIGHLLLLIFCGDTSKQINKPNGAVIGFAILGVVFGWLVRLMDLLH